MPTGVYPRPARSICSVDGCGNLTNARGWCTTHYGRWQRHGDPLAISPNRIRSQHKFTGPEVQRLAGVTYRQVDYWTRVGLLNDEGARTGSGSWRMLSESDVHVARLLGWLSLNGVTPNGRIATDAAEHVRRLGMTGSVSISAMTLDLDALAEHFGPIIAALSEAS